MIILSKIALKIEIIVSFNGPNNVHQKQYNSYKDQNKSGDNDSLEKSIQTMTDLLKTFIKKTSQSPLSLHRNTLPIEIQIKDNHTEIVIKTHTIGAITAITEIIQELMR